MVVFAFSGAVCSVLFPGAWRVFREGRPQSCRYGDGPAFSHPPWELGFCVCVCVCVCLCVCGRLGLLRAPSAITRSRERVPHQVHAIPGGLDATNRGAGEGVRILFSVLRVNERGVPSAVVSRARRGRADDRLGYSYVYVHEPGPLGGRAAVFVLTSCSEADTWLEHHVGSDGRPCFCGDRASRGGSTAPQHGLVVRSLLPC